MSGKCSCIRKDFDFDLSQDVCSDITYQDRSVFQEGVDAATVLSYTLDVTDPGGYTKSYDVTVGTPLHLDLGTCVTPGVYTFSTAPCDEVFTKKAAILCTLWCGYLRAFAKIGRGVDTAFVREIRTNLERIQQVVNSDTDTAVILTEKVIRDLKRVNCECACY